MFLIAKIVRGRRLLHELEREEAKQEAEEAAANLAKEAGITSRRHQQKGYGQPGTSNQQNDDLLSSTDNDKSARPRRKSFIMDLLTTDTPKESRFLSVSPPRRRRSERIPRAHYRDESDDGKTVRQKTETSLPSENTSNYDELSVNFRVRRTSSMPSVCDVHKISSASQVRHYNYEAKLSKLQKRSLRFTWHRLHTRNGGKRVENVFEEVYDRLVKQLPIIRDMFATRTFLSAMSRSDIASLRDHAKVTVKMIDTVIKNLDTDDRKRSDTNGEFDPKMIGRKHGVLRPYGFTGNIWEKLGETIIDVVLAQEAVRDLPGAGQAWVVLTACLVDQLRAGFEENRNLQTTFAQVANQQRVLHNAAMHLRDTAVLRNGADHPLDSNVDYQNNGITPRSAPVPLCPYMFDQNGAIVARRRSGRLSDGSDSPPTPNEAAIKPKLSIPTR